MRFEFFRSVGVVKKINSLVCTAILVFSSLAFAGTHNGDGSASGGSNETEDSSPLQSLASEVFANILKFVGPLDLAKQSTVSNAFRNHVITSHRIRSVDTFRRMDRRFIKFKVPATDGAAESEFEVLPAVTRADWEGLMHRLPGRFPINGEGNWNWENCLNCPVTHISWVNDPEDSVPEAGDAQKFLSAVQDEAKNQFRENCTYSAGTFEQWQLVFRGGVVGHENAKYTVAKNSNGELVDVIDENADQYIWHKGNSAKTDSGADIQPLGTKKSNAQGWERPSVALLTESLYSEENPELGQLAIGGAWEEDLSESVPENRSAFINPNGLVGMSIVRVCN